MEDDSIDPFDIRIETSKMPPKRKSTHGENATKLSMQRHAKPELRPKQPLAEKRPNTRQCTGKFDFFFRFYVKKNHIFFLLFY